MNRMTFSVLFVVSLALATACSSRGIAARSSGGSRATGGGSGGATSSGGPSLGGATSSGGTSTGGVVLVDGRDAGGGLDSRNVVEAFEDSVPPDNRADAHVREQDSGEEANAPVDCKVPPGIENGSVSAPATTLGSVASYTCNTGYSLSGAPTRTCQADGTWSGTAPTCIAEMLKLTINKTGTGTGTVSSAPAGIACGSTCQATLPAGTAVTLTANPDANQFFMGWDSTACTGNGACVFNLTSNTVVRAGFSPAPNIVFTTSSTQTGALGGFTGADNICASLAAEAGLSGKYVAWLSTPKVDAISRLGNARGWVRPDGKPVAKTAADIAQGKLLYPPRLDERGRDLGVDPLVMTATWSDGTFFFTTGYTSCSDFTSAAKVPDTSLLGGYASANSEMFTGQVNIDCDVQARLYCFGIDRQADIVVIPSVGRYAFMTAAFWIPGGGIASADGLCQSEARSAGLPGTYKALLAPTGASAASRFDTSGLPWIRPDGIPIAPTASAFFATTLFDAAPNITADGSVTYGSYGVWSGAANPTTRGTDGRNCVNWTSASENQAGGLGGAGDTSTASYFNSYPQGVPCNFDSAYVTCLQE